MMKQSLKSRHPRPLGLALLLAACRVTPITPEPPTPPGPPEAPGDPLPNPPAAARQFLIAAAGAPPALFGSEVAPGFAAAFTVLADEGFNAFFPLFQLSEVDGVGQFTEHITHFVSPELLGLPASVSCTEGDNPYAVADRIKILYPTFLLFTDLDQSLPFDGELIASRLQRELDTCWSVRPDAVVSSYNFDEPALFRAVADFIGEPVLDLSNVALVQQIAADVAGLPSMIVEGPGPLLFPLVGLSEKDATALTNFFLTDTIEIGKGVDQFGFDVYPVPDLALTDPGDFVIEGRRFAPGTDPLIVLQGFATERFTNGASPGRGPTEDETRFMAFDSVAAGANTVLWYGPSSLDLANSEDAAIWDGITAVTQELQQIIPWVEGEALPITPQANVGIRAFRAQDEVLFIVTNRSDTAKTITTPTPVAFAGSVVTTIAGATPSVTPNSLSVTLPAFSVSVARLSEIP